MIRSLPLPVLTPEPSLTVGLLTGLLALETADA